MRMNAASAVGGGAALVGKPAAALVEPYGDAGWQATPRPSRAPAPQHGYLGAP